MPDNQQIILRVSLDEGKTEDRLRELAASLAKTRDEQKALTEARRQGLVSDEGYGREAVQLQQQLRAQQGEYQGLTKNLELFRTATGELGNTYKGTQAQLSLAKRQYDELQGSQNTSTESTKALSATIEQLRGTLTKTDETQGLFVRNIGNYPKGESLEPLIQQLVHLQEIQKTLPAGSDAAAKAQAEIGFQYGKINQEAAAAGKSADDVQNKLKGYGEAVRPAITNLVQLEKAQDDVAKSAGKDSEAYTKLGFQIGATRKEIAAVPAELTKSVPAAEAVSGALDKIGSNAKALPGPLAGIGSGLAGTASGFITATRAALAFLATPIGLVLGLVAAAIYAVKTAFEGSAEGQGKYARLMAVIGTVVGNVKDVVIALGAKLIDAFQNPQQSLEKLGTIIKDNITTRFEGLLGLIPSVGAAIVLLFKGQFAAAGKVAADAVGKVALGVDSVTDAYGQAKKALSDFTDESVREGNLALKVAAMRKEAGGIERKLIVERAEDLDKVANLELQARQKEQFSAQQRKGFLLEAAKINDDLYGKEAKIATLRRDAGALEATFAKQTKQDLTDQANREKDVIEAGTKAVEARRGNQRLLNGINAEIAAASQKAHEAELKQRREIIALDTQVVERQLANVQEGSDEELALLRHKLDNARLTELAVKGLTVAQARAIEEKAENDDLKLRQDFAKKKALADFDALLAGNAAELAAVQKGTDAETELRRKAIDTQLQKELQALDQRKDNAAQEALLRANAANSLNNLNYSAALAKLDDFLAKQKNAIEEANAQGLLSEKEYNKAIVTADLVAAGTRLQLAKDYRQETKTQEAALKTAQIAGIKELTAEEKSEIQKRIAVAQNFGEQVGGLIAESLFAQGQTIQEFLGKILILALDVIEKQLIAQQVASIGSAAIKSFAEEDSVATFGATGFLRVAVLTAAITAAFEVAKAGISSVTAPAKQFAWGGIAQGPSHAAGGIPLYYRGQPAGIEIEGGEPVLHRGVSQNPLLLSLASTVNQLAGGRALVPNVPATRMALGGVAPAYIRQQLAGNVQAPGSAGGTQIMQQPIDYRKLAEAMSRVKIETKLSNIKTAYANDAYDASISDA